MGAIYYKDKLFSAVENDIVFLSQAEYDALTEAQKKNGKAYFVTDTTVNTIEAVHISYDNTSSGKIATNVQDAIDEMQGWKLSTTITGIAGEQKVESLNLPSGFNCSEIMIVSDLSGYSESKIIPYNTLPSGLDVVNDGKTFANTLFYSANDYRVLFYKLNKSQIGIRYAKNSASTDLAYTIEIYYR